MPRHRLDCALGGRACHMQTISLCARRGGVGWDIDCASSCLRVWACNQSIMLCFAYLFPGSRRHFRAHRGGRKWHLRSSVQGESHVTHTRTHTRTLNSNRYHKNKCHACAKHANPDRKLKSRRRCRDGVRNMAPRCIRLKSVS